MKNRKYYFIWLCLVLAPSVLILIKSEINIENIGYAIGAFLMLLLGTPIGWAVMTYFSNTENK